MRLFGKVDGLINRLDRAFFLGQPFDLAFATPAAGFAFSGNIYYFIARDVALTQAEINTFYNFFVNQYT